MTKSAASKAASAMAKSRWKKLDVDQRREATRAATMARWDRCAIPCCAALESDPVHDMSGVDQRGRHYFQSSK